MPLLLVAVVGMVANLVLLLHGIFLKGKVVLLNQTLMVVAWVDLVLTQALALEWVAVVLVVTLVGVVMLDPLMVILSQVILPKMAPIPLPLLDKEVQVVAAVADKVSIIRAAAVVAAA